MMWTFRAAALSAFALWALPAGAEPRVHLEWNAPPTCPDGSAVASEVDRLSGETTGAVPVEATAVAREQDGEWVVVLHTSRAGVSGERVMHAPDCALLAHATALALALTVSRGSEEDAASAAPRTTTPPPPPPAPAPAAEDEPTPAESAHVASVEPRHAFGAHIVFDWGSLPSPAVGPAITYGWRPSAIELEGGVFLLSTQHVSFPDSDGRGASLTMAVATGSLCYRFALALDIVPCATGEIGFLSSVGAGASTNSRLVPWVTPGVEMRARWPREGVFAVYADTSLLVPLDRPALVLDNVHVVNQPSAFVGRVGFGAELRF